MEWLATAALIVAAIVGAVFVVPFTLVWRQAAREGDTVEMVAGETVAPRPSDERRDGEFVE
jgi:Na+/proline symporter